MASLLQPEAAINPALVEHYHQITSTHLLPKTHPGLEANPPPWHEMLLAAARRERTVQSYVLAERHYTSLLERNAPALYQRTAILELALMNQEADQPAKALQIFSQYLRTWPEDPAVPEIMLRQGLLLRQLGASTLALSKFYSVMTSALMVKNGSLAYYQRLVLHAQAEIADTYYLQGKYEDAADFLQRLLKQDSLDLNRSQIQYKLVRCLAELGGYNETIAQARSFLKDYSEKPEAAEVHFLIAKALKELKRNQEALSQVLSLLRLPTQNDDAETNTLQYWRLKAGNEIANQLYLEGDYFSALEIYQTLAELNPAVNWKLPVLYQVGLVYERLEQPGKAVETYGQILASKKELASSASPGLQTVVDMAQWRTDFLNWQTQAGRASLTNFHANAKESLSGTP